MIILVGKDHNPYRAYLEGDPQDITALATYINDQYYEPNEYLQDNPFSDNQELDNIIFMDEHNSPYFPCGLLEFIIATCRDIGIEVDNQYTLDIEQEQVSVDPNLLEGITLRPYQQQAIESALTHKRGLIMAPTGSGKTAMIVALASYLLDEIPDFQMIVGVPSVYLLHQTYKEFTELGIDQSYLGRMGDGHTLDTSKPIIISTIATLYSEVTTNQDPYYQEVDCLVFDEAHHTSAYTWYTIIDSLTTEYLLGFSASPFHNDEEHLLQDLLVRGAIGSIIYKVDHKDLVDSGYISKPYIFLCKSFSKSNIRFLVDWHMVYNTGIVKNEFRNQEIVALADYLISIDRQPLITVQRIAHGKHLAKETSKKGHITAFIQGGSRVSLYLDGKLIDRFKDDTGEVKRRFESGKIDCLIGTSTLDEGVNLPSIAAVILAGGQKAQIKTLQRLGRGLRRKEGDNTTYIFDFEDDFNVVLAKHSRKRQEVFSSLQIPMFHINNLSELPATIEELRGARY